MQIRKKLSLRPTRDAVSYALGVGIVLHQLLLTAVKEQNPAAWTLAGILLTGPTLFLRKDDHTRDKQDADK